MSAPSAKSILYWLAFGAVVLAAMVIYLARHQMQELETETIRLIFRAIWVLIVALCGMATNLIAREIGNRRLKALIRRISFALIGYFGILIFTSGIDTFFEFRVSYLTSTANLIFWGIIFYLLMRFFLRLKDDSQLLELTDGQSVPNPAYINKPKLSVLIDEIYLEVTKNIEKTDALKREMVKHIK